MAAIHRLKVRPLLRSLTRCVSYVQGQAPSPKSREYFYYIDHQGQLFLDDARLKNFITSFKDKKFLEFFFKRVKPNTTGRYEADFPYVSPCGREMNYIRCDDIPIVFTHLLDQSGQVIQHIAEHGQTDSTNVTDGNRSGKASVSESETCSERLSYGGAGNMLTVPFQPNKLCMLPGSGRVYHAGLDKLGGVGLVKSSLAIELSRFFVYEPGADENSPPSMFVWRGRTWELDDSVVQSRKNHTMQECVDS